MKDGIYIEPDTYLSIWKLFKGTWYTILYEYDGHVCWSEMEPEQEHNLIPVERVRIK